MLNGSNRIVRTTAAISSATTMVRTLSHRPASAPRPEVDLVCARLIVGPVR